MPTIKQRKVFKNVVENGSPVSVAMVEAGYSKNTAVDPGKVTRSKGWEELMRNVLSDEKLIKLHGKVLNKQEFVILSDGVKDGSHIEFTGQPHTDAIKGLDMAYKLGKKYESEGINNNILVVNITAEIANKYGIRATPNAIPEHHSE